MADEQYFMICGRMVQSGFLEKIETTKRILRLLNKKELCISFKYGIMRYTTCETLFEVHLLV